MGVFKLLLLVFTLLAAFNPLKSFASRGLYFSVSKMTSSQNNTISDYKQGTNVDVQINDLNDINMLKNAANIGNINGKSFDYTKGTNPASGVLSYQELKSALDKKYLVGDVTFTLKTQQSSKKTTIYTVNQGGTVDLTGANILFNGTDGISSMVTTPNPINDNKITITLKDEYNNSPLQVLLSASGILNGGTTTQDIVIPQFQGSQMCIQDSVSHIEACAPSSYINSILKDNRLITVKNLFTSIRTQNGVTQDTQIGSDGNNWTVYKMPYTDASTILDYTTPNNPISTITNGATVEFGPGSKITVFEDTVSVDGVVSTTGSVVSVTSATQNKYTQAYDNTAKVGNYILNVDGQYVMINDVNADNNYKFLLLKIPEKGDIIKINNNTYHTMTASDVESGRYTNQQTFAMKPEYVQNTFSNINDIKITGSTSTTAKYACTDKALMNPNECNVDYPASDLNITFNAADGDKDKGKTTGAFVQNIFTPATITTNGITTFKSATIDLNSKNTFTGISKNGNTVVKSEGVITDAGIDLHPSFSFNYFSSPYASALQNMRFDPAKLGSNISLNDFLKLFSSYTGSIADGMNDFIQYSDDTTGKLLYGKDAIAKLTEGFTDPDKFKQSYASVVDNSYILNSLLNNFTKLAVDANGNLSPGFESVLDGAIAGVAVGTFSGTAVGNFVGTVLGATVGGTVGGADILGGTILGTILGGTVGGVVGSAVGGVVGTVVGGAVGGVVGGGNKFAEAFNILNASLEQSKSKNIAEYIKNTNGTYDVTLRPKDWSFETQEVKRLVMNDVGSRNLAPQFSTQQQMQSFVNALSGRSADGFEASVGYKFRLFKSSFFTAPQIDISMFRNTDSTMSGKHPEDTAPTTAATKIYTYGNLDSSYAGSLVAKFGFENKLSLGTFKIPFSIYGFGGGTSALSTYRNTKSQAFGAKFGFGTEIFVSKNLAFFGEMFWIKFLKQNINYSVTNGYDTSVANGAILGNSVANYINRQSGTTVTLDDAQIGQDTKNISIQYADLNQVIDAKSIKYTTTESFSNTSAIQGVKFGLTYYAK